ncbi:MAG: BBP7 family outer membrane beta-barrel protein [Planctomycetes bacterium]|nr:BBP7 family outer membrane beta-barrel protein [Planctomycetota bacterium]
MGGRWLCVCVVGLLTAVTGSAQVPDRPTELPPLLPAPPSDQVTPPPPATGPRGPVGEYDHSHLYLPEFVAPTKTTPETCRPLGRWWVNPSLELAWLPTQPAPGTVRLRLPDGAGGSIPGPLVPVGGRSPDSFQGGFGLSLGRFLGDAHTHAIESNFFLLGGTDTTFNGTAPGMFVVFPQGASQSSPQVIVLQPAIAGSVVGTFPVTLSTWFVGADVNYRHNLLCGPGGRLDVLGGYRFAYLRDEVYLGDVPDSGKDHHRDNRAMAATPFNGGQVGLAGEARSSGWYVGGAAKMAFGVITPDVSATGLFVGAEGATPAGFTRLAALTDMPKMQFAVLPTVNLTVGRQLREHTRIFAGYSFQYLSRVARLGDVLDPSATAVSMSDFWVQAVNFGMELRY